MDGTHVYWVNYGKAAASNGTVNEVPVGGGAVTTLADGQNGPTSVAVDSTHVYWTETTTDGTVNEVPLGGGEVTTLASGQYWPYALAVRGTHIYWADSSSGFDFTQGALMEVPVGGGKVNVVAHVLNPDAVAVP